MQCWNSTVRWCVKPSGRDLAFFRIHFCLASVKDTHTASCHAPSKLNEFHFSIHAKKRDTAQGKAESDKADDNPRGLLTGSWRFWHYFLDPFSVLKCGSLEQTPLSSEIPEKCAKDNVLTVSAMLTLFWPELLVKRCSRTFYWGSDFSRD